MSRYRASLAAKIAIPLVATTIGGSFLLGGYAVGESARHVRDQFSTAVLRTANAIEAEYETHDGAGQASQSFIEAAARHDPEIVAIDLVQLTAGGPTIVASSDPSDLHRQFPGGTLAGVSPGRERQRETVDSGVEVLQATVRFTGVEPATYAVVSMSLARLEAATADLRSRVYLAAAAAVALQLILLGWLVYRVVIRPLRRLEGTAVLVAAGRLDARVPARRTLLRDEIDAVQTQFNNTIATLEDSFGREREDAEKLARLNAQKDVILSAVSHDLRAPLAAVLGATSTLENPAVDETMRADLIDGIRHTGQRMLRMVTDLLDLDRLERGLAGPDRRDVDVRRLLSDVVAESRSASGRDVRLVCADGLRAFVDPVQVERIVDNLVLNAIKHTPAPAGIEVRAELSADDLLLTVQDSGPGVPDALKPVIFDAFSTGGSGGMGVGLSIVARFAEQHGGRAWVEDVPTGGAAFRVLLPRAPATGKSDKNRPVRLTAGRSPS